MNNHSISAEKFNRNEEHVNWHDTALWFVRQKRDRAASTVEGWEELRSLASAIKAHTLSALDEYLVQFEQNAMKNGIYIHWAANANAHNEIVYSILHSHKAKKLVKSKSMLTEECGLNHFLEKKGIEVIDTDLGERIVQLAQEPPSHIVMPAIHKKREEIDELFQQHLHTQPSGGDEVYLTREARKHLREKFISADAAVTGVNFAIAETGAIVVCTNEGNADMGVHATPLHIASMGIEKIIPKVEHLGIFLRLLARSATGQPITAYTSYYKSPRPNAEMHIVIVDNGRTDQLAEPNFRSALKCIRCGACMNTCPVYRRSGGHSYGYTIPGPIGSILSPNIDLKKYSSLPFASTLCGSCTDVCPVKIDIHSQLYQWRQVIAEKKESGFSKRIAMKISAKILSRAKTFHAVSKISNTLLRFLPKYISKAIAGKWTKQRELPEIPQYTFLEWYEKRRKR
ncbi:MAG: lactate utilization protein B [Bacteroidota bacterium]